jgi:anionic cell wall polymer biosynthesis LytR-Cps2A-Psr (LCP) family protein
MCVDEQTPVARMGCQSFTGAQALTYVRERMTMQDGDYARQRHQQQLVMALAKKIASTGTLTNPFAADRALRAMGDAVTFDGNGMSLEDWVSKLKSINPDTIKMIKTNGGQYNAQMIDGQSFEILTDATRSLFAATRDDTLDAFAAAHPDWVTNAKQ